MKKLIACLTMLLVLTALVACDNGSGDGNETNIPEKDPITLISAENINSYIIVRPDDDKAKIVNEAARLLKAAIEEEIKETIEVKADWYKDDRGVPPQECEILIGSTNREESSAAKLDARENNYYDWHIFQSGKKLVINGASDDAVASAVEYVIDNYLKDGKLIIPEDLDKIYTHEYPLENILIAGNSIKDYQIVVSDKTGGVVYAAANRLSSYILDSTGYSVKVVKDKESTEQDCEILVGETNRSVNGVDGTGTYWRYSDVQDKKLVLGGNSGSAAVLAVNDFSEGRIGEMDGKKYEITSRFEFNTSEAIDKDSIAVWKTMADVRAEAALQKNLTAVRSGSGSSVYGAHCTAVLGMPDHMVTADDIEKANQGVVIVTNYLETAGKNDTASGQGEIDFASIRLVRVLFIEDQSRIEPKTAEALKRFFLNDDYQSIHFSENHILMGRASRYLAACYYDGETFNQYGMTAEELKKLDHDYLIDFMQYRARRGWAEFNSMGYESHNFNTLLALYDCAEDEDIRTLAGMLLDTMLLTMIENSTENGIYGGSHGRGGNVVTNDLKLGIYWINMLYFGCGDFANTSVELPTFSEPYILLSKYRPDDIVYAVFANKVYPFTNQEKTHNHTLDYEPKELGFINKYTYNTELYSIGCVNKQDEGGWYDEHQQTNWSLVFAENSKASILTHHPGNDGLHSYWYGDHLCCCNHLFGNENVVMGIYYIPAQRFYYYVHAYIPKAEFDEVIEQPENNRIFVRLGDAYAVLTFSHPYEWGGKNAEKEVVIYDGDKKKDVRIAMACEAGDKATYGSFESFIAEITKKEFSFNADELSLTYGNMKYEVVVNESNVKVIDAENQYINGEKVNSDYEYTYNSPFMKSKFDSGVIEVYCGDTVRTMDFMKATDTTTKVNK